MKKYDLIVIGSGPSGQITASTAKKLNPEKSVLVITKEEKGLVPCGIPYIFYDLGSVEKDQTSLQPLINGGVETLIGVVEEIETKNKTIKISGENKISFDKLVFATGSKPLVPKFIEGYDAEGVYYIEKSFSQIKIVKDKLDEAKNVVIVGGGFIGVEVAEQLAKNKNKEVYLVEAERFCLSRAFSDEVCEVANASIETANIKLKTSTRVKSIISENGKIKSVQLENGELIEADAVVFSLGYKPNTVLAKNAGLNINSNYAIIVDNYLRTNVQDIYAVGDCASKYGFITGRTDNIMLASTAAAEARILGYNLFSIKMRRHLAGTLAVFSTEVNKKAFASCGATEQVALDSNIKFVVGKFEDVDRHPGTFDDTSKLFIKLVVSPGDGSIIGCEIIGGKSVGEMINIISLAIQKNVTVFELISFQIGTHPLLTGAPTKYGLIKAAENAAAKLI